MVQIPSELISLAANQTATTSGGEMQNVEECSHLPRFLLSPPSSHGDSQDRECVPMADGGAGVLSLFGWRTSAEEGSSGAAGVTLDLTCDLCYRCVRLGEASKLHTQVENREQKRARTEGTKDDGNGDLGGVKEAVFDPESEHRWYCPWVRAPPQPPLNTSNTKRASSIPVQNSTGWQKTFLALSVLVKKETPDMVTSTTNEEKMGSLRSFLDKI